MKTKVIQTLKLSFNKESLVKKTSKKNELKVNSNSFLENNNKLATFLPLAILVLLVTISFFTLSSSPTSAEDGSSNATDNTSAEVGVNVGLACTLSGDNTSHAITLNNGSYNDNITGTTLHTICNGSGNYNIYAIGYTDSNNDGMGEDGNNTMHLAGSSNTINDIPTGTTLDGTTSNWAIKLAYTNGSGDSSIIQNGYNNFSIIPSTSTKVVEYNASTTNTTDSTVSTTYGVSISPNQPAGTYTGQVKYTMDYTEYKLPYIQDLTLEKCMVNVGKGDNPANVGDTLTVYDKRDGNDYTVRYINGACWMTQNLRFTGTSLKTTTSNVDTNKTIAYGDLTSGNSYTEARIHDSGNETTGVWYNFAAASAMYAATNRDSTDYSYDICPKNWHLPTGAAHTPISEFYKLFQSTISGSWIETNGYLTAFDAVAGGTYSSGSFGDEEYAYWWSATANLASYRYYLSYGSNNNQFYSDYDNRRNGNFVRCVRTS